MSAFRFDTWTRRHIGLAAGAAFATLAHIIERDDAVARKNKTTHKHKKRRRQRAKSRNGRCRELHQRCRSGKAEDHCCSGLSCDEAITLNGLARRCCRQPQDICSDVSDCCYPASCDEVAELTGRHCCREQQRSCASDAECCRDLRCDSVAGLEGDHCCAGVGSFCRENRDCCENDLTLCSAITSQCEQVS